ncbi:MAG: response regulator transcription factor [Rhizobiaceae bacterium]
MTPDLKTFSEFVSGVHVRALQTDAHGLARWAVGELSRTLGFECAWYGWAQIKEDGVDIHANATLNLPDDYYDYWQTIAQQDLLAERLLKTPDVVATYDRQSGRQNDGMASLSDRYGLSKMATVMNQRDGRLASFYLSSYRVGRRANRFSIEEQNFLQCAVDQLGRAMKLQTLETNRHAKGGAISILVSEDGVGILGLGDLRQQIGQLWPDWQNDRLPRTLRALVRTPGEHYLTELGLVVLCEIAPSYRDMNLRRLTIRKLTPLDLLTNRESEVAKLISEGKSHKEAARMLGVAPSTVRNQIQAIYEKTGVNNRVNLSALLVADL